jgi:hypothetical protein
LRHPHFIRFVRHPHLIIFVRHPHFILFVRHPYFIIFVRPSIGIRVFPNPDVVMVVMVDVVMKRGTSSDDQIHRQGTSCNSLYK